MAANALPPAVDAQLLALNAAVNKLIADRTRINAFFEDGLGASVWSLLSAQNQTAVKNALVADMQAQVTALQDVVNALAAM